MQLMPPYFEDSAFTAESLIRTMDFYSVEKAVIMQSLCFSMNELVARAVAQYPDRLAGAMIVEPTENRRERILQWYEKGLRVLKFEMSAGMGFSSTRAFPNMRFDDDEIVDMFSLADELGITVTIDPSRIGGHGYQPDCLLEVLSKFPKLHTVICHLGYPKEEMIVDSADDCEWRKMADLARLPNVWFDVSALPALYQHQSYPFTRALERVAAFASQYGTKKLIWGSDIPGTLLHATYGQMIDMFAGSQLFSEKELRQLFFENASTAYGFLQKSKKEG